ncbi:putative secreted protein with PEP-CTERM sorting signal [Nitrosomonas sp. Nm84]|uniref:FxDxF family PEP-CTERM protein n=1 Tax=Nitrosomonas sp. Nm84 TaxID=200124 RepID=UPI000D8994AA|nr:FxDxF family PEP-CTERM protein [Nitrosomonas sp. Nm84]PXW84746.1 putative secreted protein with PEP-CTERM sorting signal [Nitrosomonas sp. Nm84]
MNTSRMGSLIALSALGLVFASQSQGAAIIDPHTLIPLQNATATFSQHLAADFTPDKTIDGIISGTDWTSWAVFPDQFNMQTIVWETKNDLTLNHGTVNFLLFHQELLAEPGHSLGHFRLSYTTDHRDQFADGLADGGDVTVNWIPIDPTTMSSTEGENFTQQPDFSIVVSGGANQYPIYTIGSDLTANAITGFRLEAISGRQPLNGNFALSEFVVSAVPEPETYAMLLAGLGLLGFVVRRRKEMAT